jgi:hypothetical protein
VGILLAVDLGLRSGLAWYDGDGRLIRCRSVHFADRGMLRRALPSLWQEVPGLSQLVLEGGGMLADAWQRSAERRGIAVMQVSAEEWRAELLFKRERRSGLLAKEHAEILAGKVMEWSGMSRVGPLRHDAAEAVLCGLWAVRQLGWLDTWPEELRQR